MSETTTKSCATGSCGCAATPSSTPTIASTKAETKVASKPESTAPASTETKSASPAKVVTQNGKGSAPRNMGPRYLQNFGTINWSVANKKKRQEGRREVKVYG
ncbi:MAG: hypothetical protein ACFCUX_00135 [Candidatus Methylacidiphilales bacterium]